MAQPATSEEIAAAHDFDDGFDDVVCGILVESDRVLLVHRNATRVWAPNAWDAPGGHVEPGESDFEALRRELDEELGISIAAPEVRLVARVAGSGFDLRVFDVVSWIGVPSNKAIDEHDDLAWFREEQLDDLKFADRELLNCVIDSLHRS